MKECVCVRRLDGERGKVKKKGLEPDVVRIYFTDSYRDGFLLSVRGLLYLHTHICIQKIPLSRQFSEAALICQSCNLGLLHSHYLSGCQHLKMCVKFQGLKGVILLNLAFQSNCF